MSETTNHSTADQNSPSARYANDFAPDNVYGKALGLLAQHSPADAGGAVHLDLACGHAAIAEPTVDHLGVHYVGVDGDLKTVEALQARGLEAHQLDLNSPDVLQRLQQILGERRLASLSMLDGLEHLFETSHVLQAIHDLIAEHRTTAVFSVPNVTHHDIGIKNLMGRWDYTPTGLLDDTHYTLFSEASLTTAFRSAGLERIDSDNVVMGTSDQHFPADYPMLLPSSPVSLWLRKIRRQVEPNGEVNQFVWATTAIPAQAEPPAPEESECFLSVVMRTQGRRLPQMREALLCLAAQSDQDFEVMIIAHKVSPETQVGIESLIEDQLPDLRDRIRLLTLDTGDRSAPLNLALEQAKGRYVSIFDDDDVVFGHWVESFHSLEPGHAGQVLRGICLLQHATLMEVGGVQGVRNTDAPIAQYNPQFLLHEHLFANQSPTMSWAFPISLYRHLGMRFDETLTTTEDWDFLLRASEITGVADHGEVVAAYNIWEIGHDSSRKAHSHREWRQNQSEIERRIDVRPFLLGPGETAEIRRLYSELHGLRELTSKSTISARETVLTEELDALKELMERKDQLIQELSDLKDRQEVIMDTQHANNEKLHEAAVQTRIKLRQAQDKNKTLREERDRARRRVQRLKAKLDEAQGSVSALDKLKAKLKS